MYIVLFPVVATDYFCWGGVGGCGVGVKGQIYIKKKQKWLIFAIFVLVRGVCGGRASDRGRAKCPIPAKSPLLFFFQKKQQTLLYVPERSYQNFDAMLLEK